MTRACDVFISYSHKDQTVADTVCAKLEESSIRCWIAPRDIVPGADWGASIIEGIEAAEIMLLILSADANASPQVKREVERAVHKGLHIIPLRIEDIPLSKSLEYFLSSPHWLDALTPPLEKHLGQLVRTVQAVLKAKLPCHTTCPECGKQIVSKSKLAGRRIRCPGCQAIFLVPSSDVPKRGVSSQAKRKGALRLPKAGLGLLAFLTIAGGVWKFTQGPEKRTDDELGFEEREAQQAEPVDPTPEPADLTQDIKVAEPDPASAKKAKALARKLDEETRLDELRELLREGDAECEAEVSACRASGLDQSLTRARERAATHEKLLRKLEQFEAEAQGLTTLAHAAELDAMTRNIQASLDTKSVETSVLGLRASIDNRVEALTRETSTGPEAVMLFAEFTPFLAQVPAGDRHNSLGLIAGSLLDHIDSDISGAKSSLDLWPLAASLSQVGGASLSELKAREQALIARLTKLLSACKTQEEALQVLGACDSGLAQVEPGSLRDALISTAAHPLSIVSKAVSEVTSVVDDQVRPLISSLASFDSQTFQSSVDEWHHALVLAVDKEAAAARSLNYRSRFTADLQSMADTLAPGKLRTQFGAKCTELLSAMDQELKELLSEGDRLLASRDFTAAKSAFKKIQSLSPRKSPAEWVAKLKVIETTQRKGDSLNGMRGKKEHIVAVRSLEDLLKAVADERDFDGVLIKETATKALIASSRWLESYFLQFHRAAGTRDSNNSYKKYRNKRQKAESDLKRLR